MSHAKDYCNFGFVRLLYLLNKTEICNLIQISVIIHFIWLATHVFAYEIKILSNEH